MKGSVIHDKIRRHPVTVEVAGPLSVVHTDGKILVNLEMEVRGIHTMVISNRADLLSASDLLPLAHHDPVEMPVERVAKMDLSVLNPSMTDYYHISPVRPDIAGQNDESVPDGMHGIPQGLAPSGVHDPILAEVTVRTESPGLAEAIATGRGHREVESICCDSCRFRSDWDRREGME